MNYRALIWTLASLWVVPSAQAMPDAERLKKGCLELIGIYEQRGQKNMLAGWTTSASDALLAGYCRGVLDEYRRHSSCNTQNWHEQAQRVAQASTPATVNDLLRRSCGR